MSQAVYIENCLRCGWCCKAIFTALSHREDWEDGSVMAHAIDEFPYKQGDDGYCEKFKDGLCSVYDHRPIMCDSRKMLDLLGLSDEEKRKFYAIQRELCIDRAEAQRDSGEEEKDGGAS